MSDVTLGKLIDGEAERDAIHMCVAPVISGCNYAPLKPGELIYIGENGLAVSAVETPRLAIGIVDPFLQAPVEENQKFWMILFQKTVTGIRHHWNHPSFPERPEADCVALAKKMVEGIALANDMSYEKLMEYADLFVSTGVVSDHMNADGRLIDETGHDRLDDFWKCYKAIRGVAGSGEFITCCY